LDLDTPPDDTELQRIDPAAFARDIARRLADMEAIEPQTLMELFRYATRPSAHCAALRHVLQKFLLTKTLAHARTHTAFYRESAAYGGWNFNDGPDLPDLGDLPVIGRTKVVERLDDFIADNVTLRSICHTSGTTGTPLDVYKSFEEVGFLHEYFLAMLQPLQRALRVQPLSLTFPNSYHGVPLPLPGFGMGFVSGVTDDTLIMDAHRVLAGTYRIKGHDERITLLSGLGHHILFFTSYLLEQGRDLRQFRMSGVTVTGGHVAPHWIEFLRESWGCTVNDRFTLTEAVGGASRGWNSSAFHLDPHIIGEALDVDTHAPLRSGVGLLCLTNLYPFVQMQPLVRYLTGDLVRRRDDPNGFTFEFLGKATNCISMRQEGRREWLLFSSGLNDILCSLADVRVYDWFSNVTVAHDRTVGSLPLLSVETEDTSRGLSIRLSVELRYAPHTRRQHVDGLRRAIVDGLRKTPDTTLADRMDDGSVELAVQFMAPGQLKKPIVIKI
jgi:hypothetical protein